MTLQEAIRSGRKFCRQGDVDMGTYFSASEYLDEPIGLEGYNATDYVLEPLAPIATVPLRILTTAWNDAKGSSQSVALAEGSAMFKRMVEKLKANNIAIS